MKLLLLHPLPLNGSIFSDDLRSLVDDCVAPTLYKEGPDLADWAVAALDAVGDGPVVVVGNSIGGSCAIEVALLAPTKVKALVLCGAKAGHRPEPDIRDEALDLLDRNGIDAAWQRYWLPLFGPDAPAAVVERGWRIAQKIAAPAIAAGVHAFHGRANRQNALLTLASPVVFVSGQYDRPERSRRLAERLPQWSFRQVDSAGHCLPLEASTALTAITADVLASVT